MEQNIARPESARNERTRLLPKNPIPVRAAAQAAIRTDKEREPNTAP